MYIIKEVEMANKNDIYTYAIGDEILYRKLESETVLNKGSFNYDVYEVYTKDLDNKEESLNDSIINYHDEKLPKNKIPLLVQLEVIMYVLGDIKLSGFHYKGKTFSSLPTLIMRYIVKKSGLKEITTLKVVSSVYPTIINY